MNYSAQSALRHGLLLLALGGLCLGIPVLADPPQPVRTQAIWTMEDAEAFLKSGENAIIVTKSVTVRRNGDKYTVGTGADAETLTRDQLRERLKIQAGLNRTLKADYVDVTKDSRSGYSEEALDQICLWVETKAQPGKILVLRDDDDIALVEISSDGKVEVSATRNGSISERRVYQQAGFRKQMETVRATSRCTACKSNLKNIATALEMYSTDFAGLYPTSMAPLVPNYLRHIPACPVSKSNEYPYTMSTKPDGYTFYCKGKNHEAANCAENYPAYTSEQGLIVEPVKR